MNANYYNNFLWLAYNQIVGWPVVYQYVSYFVARDHSYVSVSQVWFSGLSSGRFKLKVALRTSNGTNRI